MLHHLRAPAGFVPRVKALAAMQTERFEHRNERAERAAARAIRVVIAIEPAEPERVLPRFLQARRAVLSRVVKPLGFEEELARDRLAEIALRRDDELERRIEAAGRAVLGARAQTKCFEVAVDELCPRPFAD